MGYKRATYVLTFDDPLFDGLEVRAHGASIGQVADLMSLASLADKKDMAREDLEAIEPLFRLFAGCPVACDWTHDDQGGNHHPGKIQSWNLEEDDDTPIVPGYAAFVDQDMNFQLGTVFAWLDAVIGTPGELGKDSTSGTPSVEESIPMETLSLARVS